MRSRDWPLRIFWTACTAVVLGFLLLAWRLWLQGDDRWITVLVGGPTTLFVTVAGLSLVFDRSR